MKPFVTLTPNRKSAFNIVALIVFYSGLAFQHANAQYAVGDYHTRQSGDYGNYRTWEVWDGTQFDTATAPPSGYENIYIEGAYVSNCGGAIAAPFELHVIDYGTMEMSNDYQVYGSMEINSFAVVTKRANVKPTPTLYIDSLATLYMNNGGTHDSTHTYIAHGGEVLVQNGGGTMGGVTDNYGLIQWNSGYFGNGNYLSLAWINNYGSMVFSKDEDEQFHVGVNNYGGFTLNGHSVYPLATFNNYGTENIDSGSFVLENSGSNFSGTFNIGTPGSIVLYDGNHWQRGCVFNGSGVISLIGVQYLDTSTVNIYPTLNSTAIYGSAGALGGTGTVHIINDVECNSLTILENVNMIIDDGAVCNLNSALYLYGTVTNNGIFNWHEGGVSGGNITASLINNNIVNALNNNFQLVSCIFQNSSTGILNKDNTGTDEFYTNLMNSGTITVSNGQLIVNGLLTNSKPISVTNPGTILFTGTGSGAKNLNAGSSFTGNGILYLQCPMAVNAAVDFYPTLQLSDVYGNGGAFEGTGTANIKTEIDVCCELVNGSATVNIDTNAVANVTGVSMTGTVTNHGVINWNNGQFGNGTLYNYSTFNINSPYDQQSGTNWHNYGTMIKNKGTGISQLVYGSFENQGTIHVEGGDMQLPTAGVKAGTIIVDSGAIFDGPSITYVGNNFTNNGYVGSYYSFAFGGTSRQNITGKGSWYSITIDNPAGVELSNDLHVNNNLTFTSGKLILNNHNLLCGTTSFYNGSDSSHIEESSGGIVKDYLDPGAYGNYITLPIGNGDYTPLTFYYYAGSPADSITFKVLNTVGSQYDSNGNPTGATITSHAVNKTWEILGTNSQALNADVQVQWNDADNDAGLNLTQAFLARSNGNAYDAGPEQNVSYYEPPSFYRPSNTALGEFVVMDSGSPYLTSSISCSVSSNNICTGNSFYVSYSINGPASLPQTLTVQLSNATGSFATPDTIGSAYSYSSSGYISCSFPNNIVSGTGYRVRVLSSDTSIKSTDNGSDLNIHSVSAAIGSDTTINSGSCAQLHFHLLGTAPFYVAYNENYNSNYFTCNSSDTTITVCPTQTITTYSITQVDDASCYHYFSYPYPSATVIINNPCSLTLKATGYPAGSCGYGAVSAKMTHFNTGVQFVLVDSAGNQSGSQYSTSGNYYTSFVNPGTYTLVGYDANSCSLTEVITIGTGGCGMPMNISASVSSKTQATIYWYACGGNKMKIKYRIKGTTPWTTVTVSSSTDYIVLSNLTANKTYQYTLQNTCGAGSKSAVTPIFTFCTKQACIGGGGDRTTELDDDNSIDLSSDVSLNAFPNPTTGLINFTATDVPSDEGLIVVMNMVGEKMFSKNVSGDNGSINQPLDMSNLPSGIYLVQLYADGQQWSLKVVKAR